MSQVKSNKVNNQVQIWENEKNILENIIKNKGFIEYDKKHIKTNKENFFIFLLYNNGTSIYLLHDRKRKEYIFSFPLSNINCNYSKYFSYKNDGGYDLCEKKKKV